MHTKTRRYSWRKRVWNTTTNPRNNSITRLQRFYRQRSYTKNVRLYLIFRKCTMTIEYIAVLRVATLIFGENKMAGRTTISAKYMPSSWLFMHRRHQFRNSTMRFCNATSNFDKCHYIRWLCPEFAAKHAKSLIIAHNALENGAWFWLMTVGRYIALPLISRYHCLDPTNRDISRVHCTCVISNKFYIIKL